MTHAQLVALAVRWLATKRCVVVMAECGSMHGCQIPDAIGWRVDGVSLVVECKVSVSDFRKDRSKRSHVTKRQAGQLRYYLTPANLLAFSDLPEGVGLLTTQSDGRRVTVRRQAEHQQDWSGVEETMILTAELRRVAGGFRGVMPNGLQHARKITGLPALRHLRVQNVAEELRLARLQNRALSQQVERLRAEERRLKSERSAEYARHREGFG